MSPPAQVLTFLTQGRWYACDLLWVREILRNPKITPVDKAHPAVRGLVHLRGQILTALDLDRRIGHGAAARPPVKRCIVFKTATDLGRLAVQPPDAEAAGADLLGIVVDEIGDIISGSAQVLPPPPETLSGLAHECIAGVLTRPEGLTTLLNIGTLLTVTSPAATPHAIQP
jgi:purine-binding chemotaxis protein CheW